MPLAFGPFRLAGPFGPLFRDGEELKLPPKAAAVLWALTRVAGAIVTKDDLNAAVWPDVTVGDGALSFQVATLREALGDDARKPTYIATVHRVGFRFIAAVQTAGDGAATSVQTAPRAPAGDLAVSPSAAVVGGDARTFVGREPELARLEELFAKIRGGERKLIFIGGEAGIGKSALVELFVARAHGARVVFGQCVAHFGSGEAYLPVLEALGRLCREPQVAALVRRLAPSWLAQLPGFADATSEGAATREGMLREIVEALEALSRDEPLVLVFEDLHWSDASTLDLISMLARRREQAQLMVLATYRPSDANAVRRLKQELVGQRRAVELALGGLSRDEVRAYLARQFAERPDLLGLAALVYERTEGHALFMVEVADYLAHQEPRPPRSPATPAEPFVPSGLNELILSQVEQLEPQAQQVLEAASVAGAEFAAASLAEAAGRPLVEIEATLEELAGRGHFVEDRGLATWPDGTVSGRYGFRHALYETVLYRRAGSARRSRMHRAIGVTLERAYGEGAKDIAAELAAHFGHAHDRPRARRHHRVAADNALARKASVEAVRHLDEVLRLLLDEPDSSARHEEELTLQTMLGAARMVTHGYADPQVERAFERAWELSRAEPHVYDPARLAPMLVGLALFHLIRAEFQRARALGEQLFELAAAAAPNDGSRRLAVAADLMLAAIDLFRGALDAARSRFDRLLPRVAPGERGTPLLYAQDLRVESLATMAWLAWLEGHGDEAATRDEQALTLARAVQHPNSIAVALFRGGVLRHLDGDAAGAEARALELTALSQEHGLVHWEMAAKVLLGAARAPHSTSVEARDAAIALMRQGIAARDAMGVGLGATWDRIALARACAGSGLRAEALAAIADASARIEASGERLWEADLHLVHASLLAGPERIAALERASAIAARQGCRTLEDRARAALNDGPSSGGPRGTRDSPPIRRAP